MLEGGDAVNGMASRELGHDVKSCREVMASLYESKRRVANPVPLGASRPAPPVGWCWDPE
jgi:hypothetical protein